MANYQTKTITSVSEYVTLIELMISENKKKGNSADLLFRGQRTDRSLMPKLARLSLKGEISNIERLMLDEFKRGILPLSEFQPTNEWDLLALAQHHGLPTRLLDWTYSSLVALWFAVAKAPKDNSDGVVWVLAATVNDFRTNTDTVKPLSNKITKIFRSSVISRRISAQSGVFTVHKINGNGKMIKFETHSTFSKKLTKILIPSSNFASIRNQLHVMGVNNASVFPDIDGYCKHLEWRYSKMSDDI